MKPLATNQLASIVTSGQLRLFHISNSLRSNHDMAGRMKYYVAQAKLSCSSTLIHLEELCMFLHDTETED